MISPARTDLPVTDHLPFSRPGEPGFFALMLENPGWIHWLPGQFVMLRPHAWGSELTWARPFSISRVSSQSLVLFYQVVGRGTSRIAKLVSGDKVTVWGPLGTGFAVEPARPTLLLAGGIGIAPFYGYADRHPSPEHLSMLFGHRQISDCYPMDSLSQIIDVEHFRERTPADLPVFQDMIRARMKACRSKDGIALACGPMPFLRMIWEYALEIGLPTQLSLEQRMACGVGACLGCVTRTSMHWADPEKAGLPVQTCTSGPVFWAEDIDLKAGA